ncbi:hypothetical protein FQN60_013768, partial [Etheostoma spectabile]
YHYPVPKIFYVQLSVGSHEFIGEGRTRQAARHNAAMKALQALRNEPIPERPPQTEEGTDASKSEISLVYEIALKRNLSVNFERTLFLAGAIRRTQEKRVRAKNHPSYKKQLPSGLVHPRLVTKEPFFPLPFPTIVLPCSHSLLSQISPSFSNCSSCIPAPQVLKESGPPHMKSFLTRVSVGEFFAEGEGNSKKLSKKRAALSILQDLKKLPFIPIVEKPKTHYKKRTKTILKTGPDYGQGMNPISRLAQIQQAKKEKEPEYLLLSERGMPRRREFIMQVKVNNEVATGTGPNKKVAKRNAAEAMLLQLGYKASTVSQTPTEMDNKGWNGQKASFTESTSNSEYPHVSLCLYPFHSPPPLRLSIAPSIPQVVLAAEMARRLISVTAQKGLLHLSPDVYQEMEASRKQGGSAPGPGCNSGGSVNYMASKDMGPCSAPLPPGHSPYYSSSSPSPTATMARELLLNGQSPTADASLPMKGKNSALPCGVSVQPAQQLDYLARIQGF